MRTRVAYLRLALVLISSLLLGCSIRQSPPSNKASSSTKSTAGSPSRKAVAANDKILGELSHYADVREVSRTSFRDFDKAGGCADITKATFKVSSAVDQTMIGNHYRSTMEKQGWTYRPGIVGGPDAGKYIILDFERTGAVVIVNTEGYADSTEYSILVRAFPVKYGEDEKTPGICP